MRSDTRLEMQPAEVGIGHPIASPMLSQHNQGDLWGKRCHAMPLGGHV